MPTGENITAVMLALAGIAAVTVWVMNPNGAKVITAGANGFATMVRASLGK